jgi:hypothetical protein
MTYATLARVVLASREESVPLDTSGQTASGLRPPEVPHGRHRLVSINIAILDVGKIA